MLNFYSSHLNFSNFGPTKIIKSILVINIAENIETKIPILKVKANPLMKEVAKINKIAQTIKELKLLSRIEGQALLNPSSTDEESDFPSFISSLILEKIRILASTAIPMDRTKPPIPAKLKVTGMNLNKERAIMV